MEKIIEKVTIFGKEVKYGKNIFPNFTAVIRDTFYQVKFKRECENAPTRAGIYEVELDLNKLSLQKTTYVDKTTGITKEGTPVLWVSAVESVSMKTEEEKAEERLISIKEIFGR